MKSLFLTSLLFFVYSLQGLNAQKTKTPPQILNTNNNCKVLCDFYQTKSAFLSNSNKLTLEAVVNNNSCFDLPSNINFGCLATTENQTWVIVKAKSNGNINLNIHSSNNTDLDAAIWGPVSPNFGDVCGALQNAPLSCDYSSIDPLINLTNVNLDQYFILLITNFDNLVTNIELNQPFVGLVEYYYVCPQNFNFHEKIATTSTYWAKESINSSQEISNATVMFKANKSIQLSPGFVTDNLDHYFLAQIENCDIESNKNEIIAFSFNGSIMNINSGSNSINGSSPSEFAVGIPSIQISSGATITPAINSIQDFSKPVVYTVKAENGETRDYTVMITFPNNKLIAGYSFDGNALDHSSNNFHGTASNVTSSNDRKGQLNSSFYFNGINSKITIPHQSELTLGNSQTKEFSISIWFKADLIQSNINANYIAAHLVHKGLGESGNQDYSVYFGTVPSNVDKFLWVTGSAVDMCSYSIFTPPPRDNWHHLVLTYSAVLKEKKVFVDGIMVKSCQFTIMPVDLNADITIGKGVVYGYQADIYYKGFIDDLHFYNKVLNQNEVNLLNNI